MQGKIIYDRGMASISRQEKKAHIRVDAVKSGLFLEPSKRKRARAMQVKPEIYIHNMIDVGNKTIIIATLSNGNLS